MKTLMAKFSVFVNSIERIQIGAGILSVAVISIIIPLQVFCRFVLNAPLMWPEDIGIGLMVWGGFIGSAILYKKNEHVAVEFFRNYFPKTLSRTVSFFLDLIIGFLLVLIIIYGFKLNQLQMMTIQVGTGIPRGFFYSLPLLANTVIMFLYNIHGLMKKILSKTHAELESP